MARWGLLICTPLLWPQHRYRRCLFQLILLSLGAAVALPVFVLTGLFQELLSYSIAPFIQSGSSIIKQNWDSNKSSDLYYIANSEICHGPNPPFLLNFVVSNPSHFEARRVIRQTWGSTQELEGLRIQTLFALGHPQAPAVQEQLEQEFAEHRDLVQGTFHDTYRNLTLKTLMLLRWATTFCSETHFLLKVDDDVFVNIKRLVDHLRALGNPHPEGIYLGRIHWNVHPIRDTTSQHYTAEAEFPGERFPLYCSGTAYVVSRDVARQVAAVAPQIPIVALEDVYVGICARKIGVVPQHSAWFSGSTHYPLDTCCYHCIFTSHHLTPTMMNRAWALLAPSKERGCSWLPCRLELLRCNLIS